MQWYGDHSKKGQSPFFHLAARSDCVPWSLSVGLPSEPITAVSFQDNQVPRAASIGKGYDSGFLRELPYGGALFRTALHRREHGFYVAGGAQKRAALCAERGSSPITMVGKERLNITDRKNGSWKRQGQAVRPVPVRVSPASRSWQIHGSVPLPAVPCPLSAVSRVRDQLGQPASGTNSGPTGRTVGTDSVRLCRLRCGQ